MKTKAAPQKRIASKTEFTVSPQKPLKLTELAVLIPREDDIAFRAYLLWEKAGCPHGQDMRFWFEAEQEYEWHRTIPAWLLDSTCLRPLDAFREC